MHTTCEPLATIRSLETANLPLTVVSARNSVGEEGICLAILR